MINVGPLSCNWKGCSNLQLLHTMISISLTLAA
jgi:hypothetical protein